MMKHNGNRINLHRENAFFAALLFNAAIFPFSEALISMAGGLLLLQAIIFRSWNHPSVKSRSYKLVLWPVSVYCVFLIGCLFTDNFSHALYELNKNVFWLVTPLAVFLSPKLTPKQLFRVFAMFLAAVVVATVIITLKMLTDDAAGFSGYRQFSIISHIRFSLQVGFALILLIHFLTGKKQLDYTLHPALCIALIVWLTVFLFLLKSLVGILAFAGTAGAALFIAAVRFQNRKVKIAAVLILTVIVVVPLVYTGKVLIDFYDFRNVDPETVELNTPSGNPYHHDFERQMRENGNLVYVYINEDELRHEWNKRSEVKYDDDLNGYPLGSTLIRYLTSLGYRKDSTGISKLTEEDIRLIQRGATNYRFNGNFLSLYPRIYETVWEVDQYLRTNDPNEKTLAQRIEYIKASVRLIREKPLFGLGTGNHVAGFDRAYREMDSKLLHETRYSAHNQYINYVVKFGIAGLLWILLAVMVPFFKMKHTTNFVFTFFLIFIAIANLGDANLETHTGLSFFIFIYSLLVWNSTERMKSAVLK